MPVTTIFAAPSVVGSVAYIHPEHLHPPALFSLGLHEQDPPINTGDEQLRYAPSVAYVLREQTKSLSTLSMHQHRIAAASNGP